MADSEQRKASMRHRKTTFENRQLCRIQSFKGSGDHTAVEREQLIAIEKRRVAPATLSPYPERDLRFYLEVTCHVPDDNDDDNPVVIASSPARAQHQQLPRSPSYHRGSSASCNAELHPSHMLPPLSTSHQGRNHLRTTSSSHMLLSRSFSSSSQHSLTMEGSASSLSLTSPHRKKVEFRSDGGDELALTTILEE